MTATTWIEKELSREPIEIVAKYAPGLTPLAPTATAVIGLFLGIQGLSNNPLMWVIAILPALGSGVGMELTGFMASHLLIRAIRRGDWVSAFFSVVFLGGYAWFAIDAMHKIKNAEMFQAFVAMSIVTYLCVGLYTFDKKRQDDKIEDERRAIQSRHQQLELDKMQAELDAERIKANAEIERMKAEAEAKRMELDAERIKASAEAEERRMQLELEIEKQRTKQTKYEHAAPRSAVREQRREHEQKVSARSLGADKIAEIRAYQQANPAATVREVAEACGVSVGSVAKYGAK